jgi:hypothetical protein
MVYGISNGSQRAKDRKKQWGGAILGHYAPGIGSLLLSSVPQGGVGGIGGEFRREFADEGYHRRMPVIVETEEVHFLDGLFDSPIVFGDAIGGHHDAAAVFAVFTMDKNLLAGRAAQESKELGDLFVGRRRPTTDRNVDVAETERFGLFALGRDFMVPAAKIDDGGNAELLEFGETPGWKVARRGGESRLFCPH